MITEFQDGFITKTKLNELVGEINANSVGLEKIVILTENITKIVGTGGDFTTLNSAINWCSKVKPDGYKVELIIKSGYIFSEQIIYENVNFGFITIKKESDVIYYANDSIFTTSFDIDGDDNIFPLFGFFNSITPKFDILIRLQSTPTVNSCGLFLDKNSNSIIESGLYSGFGNFRWSLYSRSSKLYAKGSNFSTNYGVGLYIHNSECNISEAFIDMQNSYSDPIKIFSNSNVESSLINIVNTKYQVAISDSSRVNMYDGSISSSAMISSALVICGNASNVNLRSFDFIYSGIGNPKAIEVQTGGIVCANGISTSGINNILSQTANTVTPNGIIFQ